MHVRGLTKTFGQVTAVDDLSFDVADGDLFAFLGTNGAGKSTTIACMTTTLQHDVGDIEINGHLVGRDDDRIRRDIGVVFQQSLLDPLLTVDENLALRARFYGLGAKRIAELVDAVELGEFRDRRYGVLSGGQKRRVDIARALLHSPSSLFLDEPTAGLDPQSREQVWSVISTLRTEIGLTVLLTTHYMAETEAADEVLIIDKGRRVAQGTPLELRASHSSPRLTLRTNDPQRLARVLDDRPRGGGGTGADWHEEGGAIHLTVASSADAIWVLDAMAGSVEDFEFVHGSMDDVFLALTSNGVAR